jgi:holo-[acyl-carrier protein] synthase
MILGIGTDLIEIARIGKAIKRTPIFMHKIFTKNEQDYFRNKNHKLETIAGVFAAKEAVSKALGTGFRTFTPKDIEITPNHLGKPEVSLYNEAKALGERLGLCAMHITISHCKDYAVAYAIMEGSNTYEINDSRANENDR